MKKYLLLFTILLSTIATNAQNSANESILNIPLNTVLSFRQNYSVEPFSFWVFSKGSNSFTKDDEIIFDGANCVIDLHQFESNTIGGDFKVIGREPKAYSQYIHERAHLILFNEAENQEIRFSCQAGREANPLSVQNSLEILGSVLIKR